MKDEAKQGSAQQKKLQHFTSNQMEFLSLKFISIYHCQ